MTGDEGSDGAYYSVIVVPEGIYNILSGIEGDTMGTVRKQGVRKSTLPYQMVLDSIYTIQIKQVSPKVIGS